MSHAVARGIPISAEDCIATVREQILRRAGTTALPPAVDEVIAEEVHQLWRPIKTFIPVLATRAVCERIATSASSATLPEAHGDAPPVPRAPAGTAALAWATTR